MENLLTQIVIVLIAALQGVIIMYQKANNKKLDEVCHRVYHHRHDADGNVVIPCEGS